MASPDLFAICITAFAAVFLLLILLAVVMSIITAVFPQVHLAVSATHLAAITGTFQSLISGAKITRVEEVK